MKTITDSHVHLWDVAQFHLDWLGDYPVLNRSFLTEDFDAATENAPVETIVFVQCDVRPEEHLAEAQWVSTLAQSEPRIAAIVAGADLENGERARPLLDELQKLPLVKGVRRLLQGESDSEFCLRPDFLRGVQMLEEYDFSFDICISHAQLAATIEMVKRCPNVRFVLDHIAKPDIKNQLLEPWKTQMSTLAKLPNVDCKISGAVTEGDLQNWTREEIAPYIEHAISAFGWERVMFGGDWPVVLLASSYSRWLQTLGEIVSGCSADEQAKLFSENADRFYRIEK